MANAAAVVRAQARQHPVRLCRDARRYRAQRDGAVAQLVVSVAAPAIQIARANAAAVELAHVDVVPVAGSANLCGIGVIGAADSELAEIVGAPTIQLAALDRASVTDARAHEGPVVVQTYACRNEGRACRAIAELA